MKNLLRSVFCLSVALIAGCSNYERRFADASTSEVKHPLQGGAYSGRWTSASHPGGGGNLRCILTKVNDSDFRADFHATWHGMSSTHSVVLHTKPAARKKAGTIVFEGTSKLSTIIGAGTYRCEGTMDNRTLRACYDATYDRGTFEMTRVSPKSERR